VSHQKGKPVPRIPELIGKVRSGLSGVIVRTPLWSICPSQIACLPTFSLKQEMWYLLDMISTVESF
jgi:hypothetical protein